jgi:hypothetical protein
MSLADYQGNMKLSPGEKMCRMRGLQRSTLEGEIDKEFIPYLEKLNKLPFVCTTQCCTGHEPDSENTCHIDFRTSLDFEEVFRVTAPIVDDVELNVHLQVMGQEMMMPRYCFWIYSSKHWKEAVEKLIEALEGVRVPTFEEKCAVSS